MSGVYTLNPSAELHRARAAFLHYEVFEVHNRAGVPEAVAVLKQAHHSSGLAVLVRAATVAELCAALDEQGPPPLPRRDATHHYWTLLHPAPPDGTPVCG